MKGLHHALILLALGVGPTGHASSPVERATPAAVLSEPQFIRWTLWTKEPEDGKWYRWQPDYTSRLDALTAKFEYHGKVLDYRIVPSTVKRVTDEAPVSFDPCPDSEKVKDSLAGWYWLSEKSEIVGTVHLRQSGPDSYLVVWSYVWRDDGAGKFGLRAPMHGKASRKGNALAVAWSEEKGYGVGAYEISGNIIKGAAETWTRAKMPLEVRAGLLDGALCFAPRRIFSLIDAPIPPKDHLETVETPAKWTVPAIYAHLPDAKACEQAYNAARSAQAVILGQAQQLGWYEPSEGGWCGGGWHGDEMRRAWGEQERIANIYWAAWYLCWPPASDATREEWSEVLLDLIGSADYALGRLP